MAAALAGSWRREPPRLETVLEMKPLIPGLVEAGAGGLAWWKLSRAEQGETASAAALRDIFRYQTARFRVAEGHLTEAIGTLRALEIEPILGKGWAAAQAYAGAGLRPMGDIDFYVRPADFERAQAALDQCGAPVDLHRGCPELDITFQEAFARSVLRPCGQTPVRCFGPADHLRLVIAHLLRHGAWRSLWLCDVGALLEFEPLDWSLVFAGSDWRAAWVRATLKLGRDLLGARISEEAPEDVRLGPAPEWLVTTVLRGFGQPFVPHGRRKPMADRLGHPLDFIRGLRERWPNAIETAIEVGLSPDAPPSSALKLRASVRRVARFLRARPSGPGRPTP